MGQTEQGGNNASVSVVLPRTAALLAMLELCVVAIVPLGNASSSRVAVALIVAGVGAAAAQGSVASLASRGRLSALRAQPLLAGLLLLLMGHAALALALTGERADGAVLALAVVAAGGTLVSVRWLMSVVYGGWAMWLLAALVGGLRNDWVADAVTLVGASVLAGALNGVRRRELTSLAETRGIADAAAVRDSLTGLANRRGLALLGTQLLEVARRQGDAVHCVFLDVDGFGRLRAELGDEVGNDVLVAVGDALRSVTRSTDVVARWKGDEFAIVGPGPGMAPLELERRVRDRLSAEEIVDPRWFDLAITAGGAMLAPWDAGALDTLLGQADQELALRRTLRRESAPLPRRDPAM